MKRLEPLLILVLLSALSCRLGHAQAQSQPAPSIATCQANQLSLSTDAENGNFNGMSHSGTLLVLRNISPSVCRLQPVAQISFHDSEHKPVPITVNQQNPFEGPLVDGKRLPMGHGPVVVPILLASGAEATLTLRWVSGDVYDHGTCLTPASLLLKIGDSTLQTASDGHICGPDAAHVTMTATRFAIDPVYKP